MSAARLEWRTGLRSRGCRGARGRNAFERAAAARSTVQRLQIRASLHFCSFGRSGISVAVAIRAYYSRALVDAHSTSQVRCAASGRMRLVDGESRPACYRKPVCL